MIRLTLAASALALLAACGDGQPLFDDATTNTGTTDPVAGDGGAIINDGAIPALPGTDSPKATTGIFRYEAATDGGSGLVQDVAYNQANDTFTVDGIGFDGANVYRRNAAPLNTLGTTRVFAGATTVNDPLTGNPVSQITPYRALYGVSKTKVDAEPRTSFAIVRTGGYVEYGFGGYVYQRNGGVVLPSSGQATFSGDYAGVRVFNNRNGMEYTTGDMTINIDFEDFNANDAVRGRLSNRVARDGTGAEIALGNGEKDLKLPDARLVIQEGAPSISATGELTAPMSSFVLNGEGALETYETGTFNGIMAGDATTLPGGEIVGVIVLESEDPRYEGVTAQETGGTILYR